MSELVKHSANSTSSRVDAPHAKQTVNTTPVNNFDAWASAVKQQMLASLQKRGVR